MTFVLAFVATGLVVVLAGTALARYRRLWIGAVTAEKPHRAVSPRMKAGST